MLDDRISIHIPMSIESMSSTEQQIFMNYLQEKAALVKWTVKMSKQGVANGFISASPDKPFQCPVCNRTHHSRGLYAYKRGNHLIINCFSNKQYETVTELPKVQIAE